MTLRGFDGGSRWFHSLEVVNYNNSSSVKDENQNDEWNKGSQSWSFDDDDSSSSDDEDARSTIT
jgi:hypothetical protein